MRRDTFQNVIPAKAGILMILFAFLVNGVGPCPVQAQEFSLPAPGQMVALSPAYKPAALKGIKLDPKNPFKFHFYIDTGNSKLSVETPFMASHDRDAINRVSTKLIKYFLASLTIPEKDLWVNLSPYEKDRIVPQEFGQTQMGRDLLAEDYLLKQITASLIYPESQLGKEFWNKVYAQAQEKYGTTNIPINTFNKVWIVPDKAVVYENNGTAFVLENHLKVMLEEDYLSLSKHSKQPNGISSVGANIIREIVIPALTKEVNEGQNFAQLRQVFYSLILATWYKQKIKDSILNKIYSDRNKVQNLSSPKGSLRDPQYIYAQYLKAFKKGVFNYIKDTNTPNGELIPRKYFSGGVDGDDISKGMTVVGINTVNQSQLADFAQKATMIDLGVDFNPNTNSNKAMRVSLKDDPTARSRGVIKDFFAQRKTGKLIDAFLQTQDIPQKAKILKDVIEQNPGIIHLIESSRKYLSMIDTNDRIAISINSKRILNFNFREGTVLYQKGSQKKKLTFKPIISNNLSQIDFFSLILEDEDHHKFMVSDLLIENGLEEIIFRGLPLERHLIFLYDKKSKQILNMQSQGKFLFFNFDQTGKLLSAGIIGPGTEHRASNDKVELFNLHFHPDEDTNPSRVDLLQIANDRFPVIVTPLGRATLWYSTDSKQLKKHWSDLPGEQLKKILVSEEINLPNSSAAMRAVELPFLDRIRTDIIAKRIFNKHPILNRHLLRYEEDYVPEFYGFFDKDVTTQFKNLYHPISDVVFNKKGEYLLIPSKGYILNEDTSFHVLQFERARIFIFTDENPFVGIESVKLERGSSRTENSAMIATHAQNRTTINMILDDIASEALNGGKGVWNEIRKKFNFPGLITYQFSVLDEIGVPKEGDTVITEDGVIDHKRLDKNFYKSYQLVQTHQFSFDDGSKIFVCLDADITLNNGKVYKRSNVWDMHEELEQLFLEKEELFIKIWKMAQSEDTTTLSAKERDDLIKRKILIKKRDGQIKVAPLLIDEIDSIPANWSPSYAENEPGARLPEVYPDMFESKEKEHEGNLNQVIKDFVGYLLHGLKEDFVMSYRIRKDFCDKIERIFGYSDFKQEFIPGFKLKEFKNVNIYIYEGKIYKDYNQLPPGYYVNKIGQFFSINYMKFLLIVDPTTVKNKAMSAQGGINLNPALMSMQVKKGGNDFKFNFNGIDMNTAQVTGISFAIRTINPVVNLPHLLGLN